MLFLPLHLCTAFLLVFVQSSVSNKNLSSIMLSPSTLIKKSVSASSAAALCAESNPTTPSTRLAHGTLFFRSAQFSSLLGSLKLMYTKSRSLILTRLGLSVLNVLFISFHLTRTRVTMPSPRPQFLRANVCLHPRTRNLCEGWISTLNTVSLPWVLSEVSRSPLFFHPRKTVCSVGSPVTLSLISCPVRLPLVCLLPQRNA